MTQRLLSLFSFLIASFSLAFTQTDMIITAVIDGDLSGGLPKAVEVYVLNDIPDLSIYGLEAANNGGGASMEEFTFPAESATAGQFLYLTTDNVPFLAFFGFSANYESTGTSSAAAVNGDDAIVLYRNGSIVDVFGDPDTDGTGQPWEYVDGWAYRINGTGPDASFVQANWTYALGGLDGAMTNDGATSPVPIGTYSPQAGALTANNDNVTVLGGESITFDPLVNDFLPSGWTSLSIVTEPAHGTASLTFDDEFMYTPDPDYCGNDSFLYEVCDGTNCATATVEITVLCYPEYPIGLVTTVDIAGVADSAGVSCTLQGVVYGINLRPGGLQFTIIGADGEGIGIYSGDNDFGYIVEEGDEIKARGEVGQFNGLTQLYADTVWVLSNGNALVTPTVVTGLGEATESQLVTIENVTLADPGQWSTSGGSFNFDVTDGTNTYSCRIDNDVNIAGMDAPQGTFNITGIGGQFDSSSPYDEGYQLFPRYTADIDPYNTGGQNDYPAYAISTVTSNNADGEPDSLGVSCELTGIVYGINFRPGDLQFTIIDASGDGIGVFSSDGDLGYTVTEGDEIKVRGAIGFFSGLTQILAEEIDLVSSGNALMAPVSVTALGEETESQFILIDAFMTLVDPGAWNDSGGSFNVDITDGVNTYTMRVDSDTDIAGTAAPAMPFRLFGIGGQFDSSAPYDEGYQILPRYLADIDFGLSTAQTRPEGWEVFPNPVSTELLVRNPSGFDLVRLSDAYGRLLTEYRNTEASLRISTNDLPAGFYQVTLVAGNQRWSTLIVKN